MHSGEIDINFDCVCPARVQSARLPETANAAITRARAADCAMPATEETAEEVEATHAEVVSELWETIQALEEERDGLADKTETLLNALINAQEDGQVRNNKQHTAQPQLTAAAALMLSHTHHLLLSWAGVPRAV